MNVDSDASLRMARAYLMGRRIESIRMSTEYANVVGGLRGHQVEAGARYLEDQLERRDDALLRFILGIGAESLPPSLDQRPILVPRSLVDERDIVWDGIPSPARGNPDYHVTIAARTNVAASFGFVESRRQLEVLGCLVAGEDTNPLIANHLTIELATVKSHLEGINRKLGVSSRTAAAVKSIRAGILHWVTD